MTKKGASKKLSYSTFDQINQTHPLLTECPEVCVLYRARRRKGGRVKYFNFRLAKEMGLIDQDHPHCLNEELEKKILELFSLVIINEYDLINKVKIPDEEIISRTFFATRYLQLQHPDRKGRTSGDGRSIWNGKVEHRGRKWDISSCGTGATCLSPATHIQKKFFKTGDPSVSYGCGHSEIDEGLSTLFFSEIMAQNEIRTERILGIIEFSGGSSINIRASECLLRPSHFFAPLKQANFWVLNKLFNYYTQNRFPKLSRPQRLEQFLKNIIEDFSYSAAKFESDYIFCWLDWDGDNILIDGGIIDYGSVRQFGLFHHEYRYDDVDRFSTNIKEQRLKARYIVKTFIQMVDFLKTRKKKNIKLFEKSKYLRMFDKCFEQKKNQLLLAKLGLVEIEIQHLLEKNLKPVLNFKKSFEYFERAKSKEGLVEVADGLNWSAVFCMRDILRELPQVLLFRDSSPLEGEQFLDIAKSTYAKKEDLLITPYRKDHIKKFQKYYLKIVDHLSEFRKTSRDDVLLQLAIRSAVINRYDRVTGDSITIIVDKILKKRPRVSPEKISTILEEFLCYQNLSPDRQGEFKFFSLQSSTKELVKVVNQYREGI